MNTTRLILLRIFCLLTLLTLQLPAQAIIPGDVDGDNNVDRDDLMLLLAERNRPVGASACGPACDLDGDGVITVLDARRLVQFCDLPRCAIVPPAGNQPPVAADYRFDAIGNVGIDVPGRNGLLSAATDPDGDRLEVVAFDSTSAAGGSVSVDPPTGAFLYQPAAGFIGTDTFTYTITDGNGGTGSTDTGTVTIRINDRIWFVDETAAPGGDGRLLTPFNCLVGGACFNAAAADQPGDGIFLHSGNYNGGLTLKNGQALIGEGSSGSLGAVLGIGVPAFSIPLPPLGGTDPVLTSAINGINLGQDNTIRGLTIGNTAGVGLFGFSAGVIRVSETSINGSGGIVNLASSLLDVTLEEASSSRSSDGINLEAVGGSFNALSGLIENASTTSFRMLNSSASASFGGSITNTSGRSVNLIGNSGGTISFSGAISDSGLGILLNNNSATIDFSGNLALDTGSTAAFSANNSGTVTATGTNTINTATGTGLSIVNTTIGASGFTLRSISVNGAASGIRLVNTGSDGGLTVTGDGGTARNGSGGAIANTSGDAISLTNTVNVALNQIRIENTAGRGIFGSGVGDGSGGSLNSFELTNSVIVDQGDFRGEDAIDFSSPASVNVTGSVLIENSSLERFNDTGIDIDNTGGSVSVTVVDSEFDDNDDFNGDEAISIRSTGFGGFDLNVSNSTFVDIENDIVLAEAGGSGAHDVNIFDNTSIGGGGPDGFPAGGDILLLVDNNATLNFDVQGNLIRNLAGDGILVVGDGNVNGRIGGPAPADANIISGNRGDGIRLDMDGRRLGALPLTWNILVQNNSLGDDPAFPGIGDDGIQVLNRDGDGRLNLTIENNTMRNTQSEGIRFFSDQDVPGGSDRPQSNVRIANNAFVNTGVFDDDIVLRLRDTADSCFHIINSDDGFGGSPGFIELNQGNASTLQITQPSTASLSAANNGATISTSGLISFNGTCTNPPLPANQ